jgi:hypothetical protein
VRALVRRLLLAAHTLRHLFDDAHAPIVWKVTEVNDDGAETELSVRCACGRIF